jgi:hypothetical protein
VSEEFQPYLDRLRQMMDCNARELSYYQIEEPDRVAISALMMRVVEQDKSLALMRQYNLEYQKIAHGAQQLYEEIGQLKNDLKRERDGREDVANVLANYKLIARTNDIERDDLQRKHDSIYAGAHNDILNLLAVLKHGWTAGDYAVVEDIRRRWIAELGDVRPAESTGYPDYGAIDPRD